MKDKILISPYAKLKVLWDDRPENYSKEAKTRVRNHFAKKYGVNKNNIEVIYRPVKFNDKGDAIEITGADIENILNVGYQRQLMTEWLKRENKTVDFDRIIKLDDKVNAELNIENNETRRTKWAIKWITINNFLSFGEDNFVPFSKLKGLTVVNSVPSNQGGKTTLTIDALKFLLHGNTTKTDKNEDIFNTYTDKNELVVRGMIEIDSQEVIIERRMTRKAKKGGGWTVTNKVNYYDLLPDGEEKMQNEEDAGHTTTKIRKTIGSEKDFEMLVLATERNLDDLIGLTTTESSKVLTRLIGLEILEHKEAAVRTMFNAFEKKKKSNEYDVVTLTTDIEEHHEKIELGENLHSNLTDRLEETKKEITALGNQNDTLLNSKISVDVMLVSLTPAKLESELAQITETGKGLAAKVKTLQSQITEIGSIEFDEDLHHSLTQESNQTLIKLGNTNAEIARLRETIENLIEGGICSECNRKLDDVDNTEHIEKHKVTIVTLQGHIKTHQARYDEIITQLTELNKTKKQVDEKNKLELDKDRAEVEVGSLRNKLIAKKNDLTKYKLNESAIEFNRTVDADVAIVKTKLVVAHHTKDDLTMKIERILQDITNNKAAIETKTQLIAQIKKEDEVEKIFKIYIELVGKKGISKLVLRSVLPIINSELQRMLSEACDFEIEIFIDDKNDVNYLLNKDGVSKSLKSGSGLEKTASSLALRAVLGKLSTLPMPNFITFDEVLGRVSNENLEKLRPLFEKIKIMYDIVFLITHNDIVKDWGDNVITVLKPQNVSEIKII